MVVQVGYVFERVQARQGNSQRCTFVCLSGYLSACFLVFFFKPDAFKLIIIIYPISSDVVWTDRVLSYHSQYSLNYLTFLAAFLS